MPNNDDKIYLCEREETDLVPPFKCLPGRVAVLMHRGESFGSILRPASGITRPDVGVCVDPSNTHLKYGDEVLVKPYDGKWIDNYHDEKQLRLYGVTVPWHESVIAVRTPIGFDPTHDWVLIRREKKPTTLILPDSTQLSAEFGKVEAVGPKYDSVYPGDRIVFAVYAQNDLLKLVFGDSDDLAFVRGSHLLAQIL